MIWEQLNQNLILLNLEAETEKDVFSSLGRKMIEQGYAKDSYIQALADREAEFSTGLDIDGFGVAIPHTDVSHVLKSAVGIAQLKKPVTFIHMATDDQEVPVELVFMLAVVNPKDHIGELQRVLEIIQDKEVLKKLKSAESAEEIIEIVKEKEETL